MSTRLSKRLWSKGALAAATVTAAAAGITGLAGATSTDQNWDTNNSGKDGYSTNWQGHQGGQGYTVNDWNLNGHQWENDEHKKWNPNHLQAHHNGNGQKNGHDKHHENTQNNNDQNNGSSSSGWNNDKQWNGDNNDWNNDQQWSGNNGSQDNNNQGQGGNDGSVTAVEYDNEENYTVENNTDVTVGNDVDQTAVSGDATGSQNTNGGSVESGAAYNESNNDVSVDVDNSTVLPASTGGSGFDWGSLGDAGDNAVYFVEYDNEVNYTVTNNTNVDIDNNVSQTAVSGDATSKYNTNGGHVKSGDAVNVSNNTFSVNVRN